MMGVFGIGAALPLVALAFVSRSAMSRTRSKLLHAGKAGKTLLGAVMVVFHGTKRRPSRQEDVAGVLGVRA
jgi:cytochrome c biogenesis protein CcdA